MAEELREGDHFNGSPKTVTMCQVLGVTIDGEDLIGVRLVFDDGTEGMHTFEPQQAAMVRDGIDVMLKRLRGRAAERN